MRSFLTLVFLFVVQVFCLICKCAFGSPKMREAEKKKIYLASSFCFSSLIKKKLFATTYSLLLLSSDRFDHNNAKTDMKS